MNVPRRVQGLGAVMLLLVACDNVVQCDICTLTANVQGQVRTSDGRFVAGTQVRVEPGGSLCTEPHETPQMFTTDALGRYGGNVGALSLLGPDCLLLTVEVDSLRGLAGATETVSATFVLPGERPPVTRADIVLAMLGSP